MKIRLLIIPFLALLLALSHCRAQSAPSSAPTGAPAEVHSLKITILSTMLADEGIGEWGFAALSRVHVARGIFLERRGHNPNPMIAMKKEFESAGGVFVVHDKAQEFFPGVWLTGHVPRVYPEKNYPAGTEVNTGNGWVEDNVPDDQSLVFNTSHGLVLLSGCGHSGIINTLQYARGFLRPAPVDAAIGGFHLFAATDQQLAWTAGKLKEYQTARILGAHCTGIESVYRLRELLGLSRQTCLVGTIGAVYDLNGGIKTGKIAQ